MIDGRKKARKLPTPPLYGDTIVSHCSKNVALCLNVVVFMVMAGCNRGESPAASISGSASPETGSAQGPSLRKSDSDLKHPVVVIDTSMGKVTVQLDAEKAPLTTDNFLTYVSARHYDQTIVHQVYKGQGFLAGGYGANLVEKPGRTPILNEANNGLKNTRGTISMVRLPDLIDSATCQFFVNVVDNPALDHRDRTPEGYGYCVFGAVTDGMDVVDRIAEVAVRETPDFDRMPVQRIDVKSIQRIR